jgi:hypothetical protein
MGKAAQKVATTKSAEARPHSLRESVAGGFSPYLNGQLQRNQKKRAQSIDLQITPAVQVQNIGNTIGSKHR